MRVRLGSRALRQQSATRSGERRAHVVKNGESLWSISRAYDVDLRSLASWNAMAPGDVLSVGRELVVWASAPAANAAAAAAATAATPVAAIATTAQASLVSSGAAASFAATPRIREITYVVRRGDSLSSIARRFKVSVDKLVEWNTGAAGKYLQPGQRLKMVVDITEQSG
jgi:membrane-bound lytic murein transglycosylase D